MLGDGTIHNYHKHLKSMLNRALSFGIIEKTPYARLVGKFSAGEEENVEYLTEEEMKLILDTHPVTGTQMETVRDLFVIQMFTGLSYSDMQALDIKNYHKDGDAWVYNGKRIKTGIPFVSQLLPPVIEVLERHEWQVPQMPNQKYNAQLKTFGNVIGLEGLHSHLARHTFATYMLSNDVKLQNVMRMLGQKRIEQTMRYAKVLAKDVHEDFGMIADKLKKKG
jgi:integrase